MSQENKKLNNEQEFEPTAKFSEDIKKLYKSSVMVPPEIDRAILDRATQKLSRPRKRFQLLRWLGPAAAAAAVIIFAVVFMNQKTTPDIDGNGRVDILDAFKLAKRIQTESKPSKKWDINGDGRVDSEDVDDIALVAVSLN